MIASETFPAWLAGRRYYIGLRRTAEEALARARIFDSMTPLTEFRIMVVSFTNEQAVRAFTETVDIDGWSLPLLRRCPRQVTNYHWHGDLRTTSADYTVEFRALQLT